MVAPLRKHERQIGCAVGGHHVPVALQQGALAGEHGRRIVRITQFHQHPVHDGVGAGHAQHLRVHGLTASTLVQVAQGTERLHQREVRQRAQVVVHQAGGGIIGAFQHGVQVQQERRRTEIIAHEGNGLGPHGVHVVHLVRIAGVLMVEVGSGVGLQVQDAIVHDARPVQVGEVVAHPQRHAVQPLLVVAAHDGVAGLVVQVQPLVQRGPHHVRVQQPAVEAHHAAHLLGLPVQAAGAFNGAQVRARVVGEQVRHRTDGAACGRFLRGIVHEGGVQGGDGPGAETEQVHVGGAAAVLRGTSLQVAHRAAHVLLCPVGGPDHFRRVVGPRTAQQPGTVEVQPIAHGGRHPALRGQVGAQGVQVVPVPVEETAAMHQHDQRPFGLAIAHRFEEVQPEHLLLSVEAFLGAVGQVHFLLHTELGRQEVDAAILGLEQRGRGQKYEGGGGAHEGEVSGPPAHGTSPLPCPRSNHSRA